jgi:hypothetical protein
MDLPDKSCGAKQGKWIEGETAFSCEICNSVLFPNYHIGEEEDMSLAEDSESDDTEDEYIDDVTVSQSEIILEQTPEEQRATRAMKGIDVIKDRLRNQNSITLQDFGQYIHDNRFSIQFTYIVVQENKQFYKTTSVSMPFRMFVTTVAYAKYINQYDVPLEAYEVFDHDSVRINKIADRFYEEYTGKDQPRIVTWILTYGRSFKYSEKVIAMAVELWDSADPLYVSAEDQVRAVVWLELTKSKLEGTKINRAALSRSTGFDARVISRVVKTYKVYFD